MKKTLFILLVSACLFCNGVIAGGPRGKNTSFSDPSGHALTMSGNKSGFSEPQSYPVKGLFFDFTPAYSRIFNKTIYEDDTWESKGGFGYTLDMGYVMRFNRYIGLSFGLGISKYQSEIQYDLFETIHNTFDIDNDTVQQDISVSGFAQKTSLLFADVPVFIEFGNPNTNKINYYIKIGLKLSFPLSYSFTTGGQTSISGYYPEYHVTLFDIPELGFESNKPITETNETDLASVNISLFGSAGISIPVSDYIVLKLGAAMNYGLTEISEEKLEQNDIALYTGGCNSLLMAPGNKSIIQYAGLEAGVIYVIKVKY